MKKITKRILIIGLCTTLVAGSIGITANAVQGEEKDTPVAATEKVQNDEEKETIQKDETVYILANADGGVQKIIVSDWLKNAEGLDSIEDLSDLSEIRNVNGEEKWTSTEKGTVWSANGNDIYYQGTTEKELPVNINISYMLNGEKYSAEQMAGKSGKVIIRFDYTNNQFETVKIADAEEKLYVPYAAITGMILDGNIFKNVEVTNGRLVNDGERILVMGLAFPGLQENLGLNEEKLDIPGYVEITADVTDFEMGMTATIITNEVFSSLDENRFDSFAGLSESMAELDEAMSKLQDGSDQLYDGLAKLLDKSGELSVGIIKLADGVAQLKTGAVNLDNGAGALKAGMGELCSGLDQLTANNASLIGGAEQVFNTLLATANSQIAGAGLTIPTLTIGNYADVLNSAITSLDENAVYQQALNQVTAAVEANRPLIQAKVTETVRSQVEIQVTEVVRQQVEQKVEATVRDQVAAQVIPAATNGALDKDAYDTLAVAGQLDADMQSSIEAAINSQMETEQIKSMISVKTDEQMATESTLAIINNNIDAQMQTETVTNVISENVELQVQNAISENMTSETVQKQLAAASDGVKSLISLKSSLDSYNSFYLGLKTYTSGVSSAAAGAAKLNAGATELKNGATQLATGAITLDQGSSQLKEATPALIDGITQLKDGSRSLSEGLTEFNESGIQKLISAVDGDLNGVCDRLKATIQVSKNYQNYSGLNEIMSGKVKFIYRTDEISIK